MTLEELNCLTVSDYRSELSRCCGSSLWTQRLFEYRPFKSAEELLQTAERIWWSLTEADWKEAFAHHPKIGDVENLRKKFAATADWASNEQAGATNTSEETLKGLAEGNRLYEEKFGYIFIVCATGKSAHEMLQLLQRRMRNLPEEEIRIAAGEQAKIIQLRLKKLLNIEH